MKKTLLLTTAAATLFAVNASAMEWNPYVSGNLTYSDINVDGTQTYSGSPAVESAEISDKVYGFNMAVGASTDVLGGAVRGEFEYGYKDGMRKDYSYKGTSSTAIAIMKADVQTYMFNAYYDIDTGTKFTPYVGAGLGIAHINAKSNYTDPANTTYNTYMSETEDNLAWQVSAGVGYALNDKVTLNAGYRYTDLGSVETIGKSEAQSVYSKSDLDSHEVMLGARYTF